MTKSRCSTHLSPRNLPGPGALYSRHSQEDQRNGDQRQVNGRKYKKTKSEVSDSVSDVSEDFQALRDDVDELLRHIGALAKAETSAGVDSAKKTRDKAVAKGEEALDNSRDYIRDHPLVACSAALGAGFVAALMMRR